MSKEKCICGKHFGKPRKVSKNHWCYDEKYKLPALIEGSENKGGKKVYNYNRTIFEDKNKSDNLKPSTGVHY